MRCEKLRRIYFKYIDGELSRRKARLLEEHVRDCPVCTTEAKSIERMRSLLQTAGQVKTPDTYWDTYWDRLEKKLPGKPSPVSLISRVSSTFASLFRQPAVLGRVAIYALFLAILIYMAPDYPSKITVEIAPGAATSAPVPLRAAEGPGLRDDMRRLEVTDGLTLGRQTRSRVQTDASLAQQKDETVERQLESMADKEQEELRLKEPVIEAETAKREETEGEMFSWAAPAKPAIAPEQSLAEVQDHLQFVVENEDEYVAADNYFREGEYPQAIVSYQNFIVANSRVDMDDERMLRAVYQLGEANYQIGNYSEALSNFAAVTNEEVPKAFGIEDETMMRGARARSRMVSKLEAGKEFKEARSDAKAKHSATNRGLALYYDRQQEGDLPKTREKLISLAVFRQAESYERLGKLKEALTKYEEYVGKYPRGEYVPQAKEKIAQVAR